MTKKKDLEKKLIKKYKSILKYACVLTGIIGILYFGIKGGFASLLFGLRESKTVVGYCIAIIILLALLVICNISDAPENQSEKQKNASSYITVGIIIVIVLFGILLLFTLIDFFLPVIVIIAFLVVIYYLIGALISFLINKYGVK